MSSFWRWFSMGGYSLYIWPAYTMVIVVLGATLLSIQWQKRRVQRKLKQWFQNQNDNDQRT